MTEWCHCGLRRTHKILTNAQVYFVFAFIVYQIITIFLLLGYTWQLIKINTAMIIHQGFSFTCIGIENAFNTSRH